MASIKAVGAQAPKYMSVDGDSAYIIDKVVLTANPAVGDTLDFRLPAGMEVASVQIQADKLDTNATPLAAFSVGFAPIQAETIYTADPTYFAPVGQTLLRTGGRQLLAFKPRKFEEDVWLRITIGAAAATFAPGEVFAIVDGNCVGLR